jgi:hypothetical protein
MPWRPTMCLLCFLCACSDSRSRVAGDGGEAVDGDGARNENAKNDGSISLAPVCDRSESIRLGMWRSAGNAAFMTPYGATFAFVDGQCRFHASRDAMLGIATGTLSEGQAAELATEIAWNSIGSFSDYYDGVSCFDGGGFAISNGTRVLSCDCKCDDTAPGGLSEAIEASKQWPRLLADGGELVDGPVRVAAIEQPTIPVELTQVWPLSRPLADFTSDTAFLSDPGVLVEDSADVTELRQLRRVAAGQTGKQIYVKSNGLSATLYVRDELPSEVDSEIRRFQSR